MSRTTRRVFLVGSAAMAGGLAVGYRWAISPFPNPLDSHLKGAEVALNPFVTIGQDSTITLVTPRAEMGQGAQTGMAQLIAEELDVSLDRVRIEHGPAGRAYMNWALTRLAIPFGQDGKGSAGIVATALLPVVAKLSGHQITGGSSSIVDGYDSLRLAGATARALLISAAAARTGTPRESITTENGVVVAGSNRIPYGDLVADAAKIAPPSSIKTKPKSQWKLIGKSVPRVDLRTKVTGAPIFGIDVRLPNMLFATVRMNPNLGAGMRTFDPAQAKAMPGVVAVVDMSDKFGGGIGVIANNTWRAFQAANALAPTWLPAAYPTTTEAQFAKLSEALDKEQGHAFRRDGDSMAALKSASNVIEAEYRAPFLAHTTMEPMNATALFDGGKLTLWVPTQIPTLLVEMAKREFGLKDADIEVVTTFMGGGFGRRLELDFARYAIKLAMAVERRPVKVTWTREEDITHDFYRPASLVRFRGAVGANGLPVAVHARIATPSVGKQFVGRLLPDLPTMGPDASMAEGIFNQPVTIPNILIEGVEVDLGVPVGNWRSVGNSQNGFFHETFLDELARVGNVDPVAMRLKMMEHLPIQRAVIERVAAMANWQWGQRRNNTGRGFAAIQSFRSMVATIVEVEDHGGKLLVTKVWSAIDVGTAVNPQLIRRQVESAIVYGLSAAMFQEITFKSGTVRQSNFPDYEALRINQMPATTVDVLEGQSEIGGVGEPGLPPVIPALGNAIFDLTGKRLRTMPFLHGVKFVS